MNKAKQQNTEADQVAGGDLLLATQRAAIECAEQRDALAESLQWIVTRLERGGKAATSDAIDQARAVLALAGGAK